MKQQKINPWPFVIICLILFVTVLLFMDINNWKKDTSKCLLNPFSYGADKWGKINNANLSCVCSFDKQNMPNLYITKYNVTAIEISSEIPFMIWTEKLK